MTSTANPVFVCGADRSGTSLMFALLSSHPNISMVRRTNMWRWFNKKFGDLSDPGNLDRAIEILARYKRLAPLEPNWDRIRTEFSQGEPSYGRLFDLLHSHRADRIGRPRWGDKSLHSEYFADAIFAEYPNARVVQTVRDPRDRFTSIANRYDGQSKGIGSVTGRWLASANAAEANLVKYPDRYSVVRFEDLARDPIAITRQTCEFIGEEFVPEMMDMSGAPEHSRGNSSFGDLAPHTISTKPIGRYRTALTPAQTAFIQLAAGRSMRRLGYELDAIELDPKQRLLFGAWSAPRDLSRMAAWSLHERFNRSRATAPGHRLAEVPA